jgi:hypothetical protein
VHQIDLDSEAIVYGHLRVELLVRDFKLVFELLNLQLELLPGQILNVVFHQDLIRFDLPFQLVLLFHVYLLMNDQNLKVLLLVSIQFIFQLRQVLFLTIDHRHHLHES